ncbi:MAG: hypothetical protein ACRCY4_09700 [Brevinema sp.]
MKTTKFVLIFIFVLGGCTVNTMDVADLNQSSNTPTPNNLPVVGSAIGVDEALTVPGGLTMYFINYNLIKAQVQRANTAVDIYTAVDNGAVFTFDDPSTIAGSLDSLQQRPRTLVDTRNIDEQKLLVIEFVNGKYFRLNFNDKRTQFYLRKISNKMLWFHEIDALGRNGTLSLLITYDSTSYNGVSDFYPTFSDLNSLSSTIKQKIAVAHPTITITSSHTAGRAVAAIIDIASN